MGIILVSAVTYADTNVVGALVPIKSSSISNEVVAVVDDVRVNIGDVVDQGDVLAVLDSKQYELQHKLAESEVALSTAELNASERQLVRIKGLYEKSNASVSQLDESQRLYEVSKAQLKVAVARLDLSKNTLDKAIINAPFDAWIGARHIEKGQLLNTSTQMFELVDISKLKVVFYLLENDLKLLKKSDSVEVSVPVLNELTLKATVEHIAPQPSTIKPGYRVEAILENSDFKLRPGFTARIRLSDEEQKLIGE
jgi:membrane fusion protein (multidrug efflux system)